VSRRTVQITGRPEPYRRPNRTTTQIRRRPDRVAGWAVLLGIFMVFMAVVTAQADAGQWHKATLGDRTLKRGTAGNDVKTLQILLTRRGFEVPGTGYFGPITKRNVKRFQRSRGLAADGVVGPMTRGALAPRKPRKATWYGPGLYGNGMACGGKLTKNTWGVAHKTLPCGTKVAIAHGGRIVIAPVVDRGPYAKGVSYDLTAKTARALRMLSTSTVRAGH
jgi:peptidoglycan hydrolase-like protein with peptidoglycan-binding domain